MSRSQIIRAWKDPEYRSKLSKAEREQLPAHPAGLIELSDDDLGLASGGKIAIPPFTKAWTCRPIGSVTCAC
jgi:mersacidin/lichenicidin family type 2 lantibiotic